MINLQVGKTYRHSRCLDMDMHIGSLKLKDNGDFEAYVIYLNRHYKVAIGDETVTLKRSELRNWKALGPDEVYDVR